MTKWGSNEKTREIIKSEASSQLGAEAIVRLFGSRVDNAQRGEHLYVLVKR